MDIQQQYEDLVIAVKKMLAAQAEARKNKTSKQKWIIANSYEKEVKEILDPKPKVQITNQATIDWLGQ